jgi:hypothetical protein
MGRVVPTASVLQRSLERIGLLLGYLAPELCGRNTVDEQSGGCSRFGELRVGRWWFRRCGCLGLHRIEVCEKPLASR